MNERPEFSLLEGAVAIHEMFISYVKASFTREEALKLVIIDKQQGYELLAKGGEGDK